MATQIALRGDGATAVYDDRWRSIYEALGGLTVQRASEVEFNHQSGEWEATHLESGQIIARGPSRRVVIEQEVEWLEAREITP